eukprot:TRINITY_DN4323_c0_g1_i10.p1 TRINITY_DN4323_c0_g1~~TRINITY_DN4323_c0_g1_i10.p1  ORF type:complete len:170 (-),score=22.32 TRINITY_DN4323_c0_g1_i10:149-658(-)
MPVHGGGVKSDGVGQSGGGDGHKSKNGGKVKCELKKGLREMFRREKPVLKMSSSTKGRDEMTSILDNLSKRMQSVEEGVKSVLEQTVNQSMGNVDEVNSATSMPEAGRVVFNSVVQKMLELGVQYGMSQMVNGSYKRRQKKRKPRCYRCKVRGHTARECLAITPSLNNV